MKDKDCNLIWESFQEGCGCAVPVLRQDPKEKLKDLKRRVEAEEELGPDKTVTVAVVKKESKEELSGDWKEQSITGVVKWFNEYPDVLKVAQESDDNLKLVAQRAIVDHYEVEEADAIAITRSAIDKVNEGNIKWDDEKETKTHDRAVKNETFKKLRHLRDGIVAEQESQVQAHRQFGWHPTYKGARR